jgi:resuscitation-promoting factor RpfB
MAHSLLRHSRTVLLLLVVAGAVAVTLAFFLWPQRNYIVYADGQVHEVTGSYERVGDVLAAAGVAVRSEDIVAPPLTAVIEPGSAIQIQRAKAVTIKTDSGVDTVWSLQPHLAAFLNEAGLRVQRTDQVYADGLPVAFNALDRTPLPAVLEIGHFVTVTIHEGAQQQTLRTAALTVGQVLNEAGVTIYAADGVDPPLGSWITANMQIYVQRSIPVRIVVDGRVLETRSHHNNVLALLGEAGIALVGQDFTRPTPDAILRPGDVIQVIRVTEDFRLEDQPLPYLTLSQATDQLELDQRALLSAGVPGILRRRIRVRYENGAEVSQTADGEWVAREPVNEVIGYGTQIIVRALETPHGTFEYWRKVRMRVTAYTAASSGKPPEHPAYGITASGLRAGTGIVAVDRSVIPFRSWVYVPGYGPGFAGDTGGGVRGRWIDLGYDEADYRGWSGYVDVYYLVPVPEPGKINYLLPTNLP